MPISNAPIAVCSWSLQAESPAQLVERVRATGASAVQLALTPLVEKPDVWGDCVAALTAADIEIVSGMLETVGEDYSTLETIRVTGGVVPDATWHATRARAVEVAKVAGRHGIRLVTFHAGFIPHEAGAERDGLFARLREIAAIFRAEGSRIAFETGQESAETLAHALDALGDDSIGVNFDPANMILYGTGEPIEALRKVGKYVRSVHCKDATWSSQPGKTWGAEVPLGKGQVDIGLYLQTLKEIGYSGPLTIEREIPQEPARQKAEIQHAVELLNSIKQSMGFKTA